MTGYSLLDYVFPMAEPLSKEDQERAAQRLRTDKARIPRAGRPLVDCLNACQGLLDKEDNRKQGIEARLTSVLGLSSIAGTVAFGGFFLGSSGMSRVQSATLRWSISAVGCYLILQICAAILAAVQGLSRRPYSSLTLSDLVARPGESRDAWLHRKAQSILEVLSDHDTQNNQKLTKMAVAHCAMRNFVCGLLVFTSLAAISAARVNGDELVDRLKKDHDLNELLRGPQGPRGIPGPKGDPGLPGNTHAPRAAASATGKRHNQSPCTN